MAVDTTVGPRYRIKFVDDDDRDRAEGGQGHWRSRMGWGQFYRTAECVPLEGAECGFLASSQTMVRGDRTVRIPVSRSTLSI